MKASDFTVGQMLWYVPKETRHAPFFCLVSKIGRVWLGIEGGSLGSDSQCNVETMVVWSRDRQHPHGVCWADRRAYEARQAVVCEWEQFRAAIGEFSLHRPPDGVTIEDIQAARKSLRLK